MLGVPRTKRITARLTIGATVLLVAVGQAAFPIPVAAASGEITTYVGGLGAGAATSIRQVPLGLTISGTKAYVVDAANAAVRVIDLGTGNETVVAGNGAAGFGGDGGPATSAQLQFDASAYWPSGVAVDSGGNLYVSDTLNHRIRKVTPGGVISTIAGTGAGSFGGDGGPATQAYLYQPAGLALDSAGNLFVADDWNNRVRKITPTGTITTVAGGGTGGLGDGGAATSAQLWHPFGVYVDGSTNIYIAEASSYGRIRKVTAATGIISTVAGGGPMSVGMGDGGPATSAFLYQPGGVTFDATGNMYIADQADQSIRQVTTDGIIHTIAGAAGWPGFSGDGGPASQARLFNPMAVAFDGNGNLLIADTGNSRIRRIDTAGIITTYAGNGNCGSAGDGGAATSAQLCAPSGLAVDATGNLYVADTGNGRVRKVTPAGVITTVAGGGGTNPGDGGPATAAVLSQPSGIAVDTAGNLYIADTGNNRLRKVSAAGTITTIAGNGTAGFSGDGGPATSAQLNTPNAVALDSGGNVFIADSANNRVREVTAAGIISTFAGGGTAVPGDGGPATAASLANPSGVAVDAAGTLYLADTDRGSLQKVTPDGTIGTIVPGNTCCVWDFTGLAVTSSGYLLSAVPRQQNVYITGSSGTLTVVAGTGTAGFAGDGGPATAAQLRSPTGVAVDAAGNRYIADAGNNRVRRVQAASPPGAPTNVKASPGAGFAFVSWTAPPDGGSPIGSYTITPLVSGIAQTPTTIRGTPPPTSATITGLDNKTYTFTVTASNDTGTGPASAPSNAVRVYGSAATDCGVPIAVAAGVDHRLVLKSNGAVWGWGDNFDGELGTGSTVSSVSPVPSQMTGAIAIAVGSVHSLALKSDGTVWGWGDNSYGQLGTGSTSAPSYAPVTTPGQVINLSGVIAIAAGAYHSLALKSNGTVWAWGLNTSGQLGNGTATDSAIPVQVSGLTGISAIAGGNAHSLALKSNGTVWVWGSNTYGQLGQAPTSAASPLRGRQRVDAAPTLPSPRGGGNESRVPRQQRAALLAAALAPAAASATTPAEVPGLGGSVTAVAGGFWHSLALKSDGSVWAWGDNYYGELGTSVGQYDFVPPQAAAISGVVSIAGGRGTSVAAKADGTVWAWGYNWPTAPTQVGGIGAATLVADGSHQFLALDANSQVWEWGLRSIATPIRVTGTPTNISQLSSGDFHSLLLANGQVWAWGWNGDGQLGNGSMIGSASPVQTTGLPSMGGPIAAGSYYSLAADAQRFRVWAWGDNGRGQLGLGTANYISTDTAKPGAYNPTTISAGGFHSLVTDNSNQALAYGSNFYGELGQPTSTTRSGVPTAVPGSINARSVAAGRYHSLAAMDAGRVLAWGDNLSGQLGNGSFTSSSTPVQVIGLPSGQFGPALPVWAGAFTSFTLDEAGNLYGWGYNGDGELGIGTTTDSSTAVQIPGFKPFGIAPGAFHVLARKFDGTVWAWGDNSSGQLGNGTAAASYTPAQVPGLTNVVAVAAGGNHSLALKQDGSVWQWGAVYTASPVQVTGLINPAFPIVSSLSPTNGSVGGGTTVTISGRGFSGATGVSFGGVAATSFTVNSDSQITATAPAGKPGPVDVTVSTSACASGTAAVSRFTYGNVYSGASDHQYVLKNSNGTDWADMDPRSLVLLVRPAANQSILLTANADLFTGTAGYNQDLGIFVSDNGAGDQLLAWKESGGYAGIFSPNAAYVQYLFNMTAGHTYIFKLKWKTNINAPGATIYAGAGSGPYSLTSLIGEIFPTGVTPNFAASTSQYTFAGSNGVSWQAIDAAHLSTTLTPVANATAVLGGNADLWTANAGYNQDLGIFVSDNGGPDTLVGWKESGGFAGTFSPNAAFVKATYAMTGGHAYTFKLKWKTNKNAPGATIFAAAGSGPAYSQTSLLAQTIAAGANPYSAVSTSQYSLPSSDGAAWQTIDAALNVPVTPSVDTNSIIGANVDLWTASPGFNQDIGIFVSDNGGPEVLLAWKESGGFAGTFSPNAAFAQAAYPMTSGHAYVFKLKWKTNKNAPGATIFAAAGGGPVYSQTRLTVELAG